MIKRKFKNFVIKNYQYHIVFLLSSMFLSFICSIPGFVTNPWMQLVFSLLNVSFCIVGFILLYAFYKRRGKS
jgi:hypothetical protein